MIGQTNLSNRNSWIKEQLHEIHPGLSILDAGAGEQQWKPYCINLNYESQDFAQYNGTGDGKGLQCKGWDSGGVNIVSDITSIPRPDVSYDVILCSEVLDHVPDPVRAVQELIRLLKPGGTMLLTESFCGLTNQSPYFYYTGLSVNWYEYWLKGFDLKIWHNGNYYEWIAQEVHRLRSWGELSKETHANMLGELSVSAMMDKKSHEILCYGLLVKAIKNV